MDEVKKNSMIDQTKAQLALPDELPLRPDLSHLPDHVLRSTAVETLLQQNDELMSRLSVSLRRISNLENTVDSQENSVKKFRHHYEVLKDEVYILNEKTQKIESDFRVKNEEHTALLKKYKAIDNEYTRLFNDQQADKETHTRQHKLVSRRLQRYMKYRQSLSPLLIKLRSEKRETEALCHELDHQNKALKEKLETLTTYIQRQADTFKNDKNDLLNNHKKSSEALEQQSEALKEFEVKLETISKENIQLKNENIEKTRTSTEIEQRAQKQVQALQQEANDYKLELKKIKVENLELKDKNHHMSSELEDLTQDQKESSEQLENTQLLFSSLQKKLEQEQIKTASLQKINRQLSQEMSSYRRTIHSLKDLRDQTPVKKEKTQVKTAPKTNGNPAISDIENLIFEIEKDFR